MRSKTTSDRTAPTASASPRSRASWIFAAQALIVILIIAGMQVLNVTSGRLIMPAPADIWKQSLAMWGDGSIPRALGQTIAVLVLGFLTAAISGVLAGILLGGIPVLGRVFDPFVNALNATPSAAFIPLIIVWFGLYTEAKVALVWNAAFFPILISTASGVANANRDLIEMAQSFGADRRRLFWQVMVPDALPAILSGLRIGAAIAIVGTVIAELTMAQSGLGGLMIVAGNRFQMDRYFAVVLVMMALGTALTAGLRWVERRFGRWRVAQAGGR